MNANKKAAPAPATNLGETAKNQQLHCITKQPDRQPTIIQNKTTWTTENQKLRLEIWLNNLDWMDDTYAGTDKKNASPIVDLSLELRRLLTAERDQLMEALSHG